jgi:hypothetical protein
MWLGTCDMSISGQARNPLEWFPSDSPEPPSNALPCVTPVSVPQGFSGGGCFLVRRFPCLLTNEWPLADRGPSLVRSPSPTGPRGLKIFSPIVAPEGRVSPFGFISESGDIYTVVLLAVVVFVRRIMVWLVGFARPSIRPPGVRSVAL